MTGGSNSDSLWTLLVSLNMKIEIKFNTSSNFSFHCLDSINLYQNRQSNQCVSKFCMQNTVFQFSNITPYWFDSSAKEFIFIYSLLNYCTSTQHGFFHFDGLILNFHKDSNSQINGLSTYLL